MEESQYPVRQSTGYSQEGEDAVLLVPLESVRMAEMLVSRHACRTEIPLPTLAATG